MPVQRPIVALLAYLVTAACSGEGHVAERFLVADSAGHQLARSQSPRSVPVIRPVPSFEFGEASGPDHLLFDRIRGVTRLADGAIVVGNRGTNTIRILDESGHLLGEFGGTGEGPGEFTSFREVRRCKAGLITAFSWDYTQVQYSRSGQPLSETTIRFPSERPGIYRLSCDSEGRLVGIGFGDTGLWDHPTGNYRAEAGLWAGEDAGGPFLRLATTSVSDRVKLPEDEGPHPFGRTTVLAAFNGGFVLGTADAYAFTVHSFDGDTTHLVRWAGPRRTLDEDHIATYLAWRLANADGGEPARIRREVAQLEMPDSLPAYGGIQIDPAGNIWVQEFGTPWLPPTTWWGFLPTGEWAWELRLDPDFNVSEIGDEEILGVATDELGIERVRGYRLDLPGDST